MRTVSLYNRMQVPFPQGFQTGGQTIETEASFEKPKPPEPWSFSYLANNSIIIVKLKKR